MKKAFKLVFKILGYTLGGILVLLIIGVSYMKIKSSNEANAMC